MLDCNLRVKELLEVIGVLIIIPRRSFFLKAAQLMKKEVLEIEKGQVP